MPRLTKLYTRQGDDGMTALGGGKRVSKDALRVHAYGTVDELNAALGVALAHGLSQRLTTLLASVQNELFHLGTGLAFPDEERASTPLPHLEPKHVVALEGLIDELTDIVGPLKNFVLPGGSIAAANLQLARTICRRAERDVVALASQEPVGQVELRYLNRLSDLLFAMARYENHVNGIAEPLWNSLA